MGAECWKDGDLVNEAPILLLPEILCTGLSRENAVAARPKARKRTFVSFTILLPLSFEKHHLLMLLDYIDMGCKN